DLVRTRVVEVLALEEHLHAQLLGEPRALGERRGTARVVGEQLVELGTERRIGPRLGERNLELLARGNERLGDEPPTELAEAAVGSGRAHQGIVLCRIGHSSSSQSYRGAVVTASPAE